MVEPLLAAWHALREQTAVTVSLGLTGKLCLDMDQLPVINEVISPTPSDVAWARDFLAEFDVATFLEEEGAFAAGAPDRGALPPGRRAR